MVASRRNSGTDPAPPRAKKDRRLRIIVVAPPWYGIPPACYGGIERVCHFQVEALIDRGHEVTLIAAGRNGTRAAFRSTFDVAPDEGGDGDAFIEVTHAARAIAAMNGARVDIVHDHSLAGPLTAATRSAPTVVTAHMALSGIRSQLAYLEAIAPWSFLVPISHAQRSSAPHIAWMRTVRHGIDIDRYPFQERKGDYVLFLGRISPEKGTIAAIHAARASGYRLILAGRAHIARGVAVLRRADRAATGCRCRVGRRRSG